MAEISALKKEAKRVSNQRAMLIAAKLSGPSQDRELKAAEFQLVKVEAEINNFRGLLHKGELKIAAPSVKSDFLELSSAAANNSLTIMLSIESLVSRLEVHRNNLKDQVQ